MIIAFWDGPMHTTSLSVTELVWGFSDYVHRVAYRGERFIVFKGKKPVAELRPIAADIETARVEFPVEESRDPWQS